MMKAFKAILGSTALTFFMVADKVHAQLGIEGSKLALTGVADRGIGLATVIGAIVNFFLGFVGLVAVLILIYGGFNMITAAGDPEKFGKGRQMIIYAIIGIVIIVISWTVVGTLLAGLQAG